MQAVRRMSAGVLAGLLIVGLSACGDDKKDSASTATDTGTKSSAEPAPEEVRASDADVASGLAEIKTIAADIATYLTSDHQRAADQQEKIEPTWAAIEGTIKANDQEAYLTFEDQFAVLSNAVTNSDQAKADAASALVVKTADEYLAKHPASPSDNESSSPSPTAS
jgi:hypothetical protein